MRYGWTVSHDRSEFGELIEVTSENAEPVDGNGLTFLFTGPDRHLVWVDATIDEAYARAIRAAQVRLLVLEIDRRKAAELTIGTIDTPLADVKELP